MAIKLILGLLLLQQPVEEKSSPTVTIKTRGEINVIVTIEGKGLKGKDWSLTVQPRVNRAVGNRVNTQVLAGGKSWDTIRSGDKVVFDIDIRDKGWYRLTMAPWKNSMKPIVVNFHQGNAHYHLPKSGRWADKLHGYIRKFQPMFETAIRTTNQRAKDKLYARISDFQADLHAEKNGELEGATIAFDYLVKEVLASLMGLKASESAPEPTKEEFKLPVDAAGIKRELERVTHMALREEALIHIRVLQNVLSVHARTGKKVDKDIQRVRTSYRRANADRRLDEKVFGTMGETFQELCDRLIENPKDAEGKRVLGEFEVEARGFRSTNTER